MEPVWQSSGISICLHWQMEGGLLYAFPPDPAHFAQDPGKPPHLLVAQKCLLQGQGAGTIAEDL